MPDIFHVDTRALGIATLVFALSTAAIPMAAAETALLPDKETTADTPPSAPEDGGPRRWKVSPGARLVMRETPDADAPPIEAFDQGEVLANLGCREVANRVWCEVRSLAGGPRGHVSAGRLVPVAGPDGVRALGVDDSPRRARRGDFDARATIACAQDEGRPMGRCAAGVARGAGGDAVVVATFPNGFRRVLFFENGMFLRGDATMSGVGTDTAWRLEDGMHVIRVDDQRFDVPDALITGR
ncbi:hypothetical protein [Limimaricola sp.]|uniref:hypothetical protein n=1 Tax=Limimaricola sp. TaxID=2211665 RepID=UPI004059B4E5